MSKTISANVSQDENNRIEQYCKDNKISKSDLIKNSVRNTIEHKSPSKGSGFVSKTTVPTQIEDSNNFMESIIKELEYRDKLGKEIREEVESQTKLKHQKEILEHLKNKNCGFWKDCEICNAKNSIKNARMREQENIDLKIFEKYLPQLQAKMIR